MLEEYDLVITSYGTLRQDAELLGTMDWCVVIGDEAQHIKNRRSQNAKTLSSLHAEGRFLLTGTPVENSLDDLLSLFSFLMPGYLQKPAASSRRTTRPGTISAKLSVPPPTSSGAPRRKLLPSCPRRSRKLSSANSASSNNASIKILSKKPAATSLTLKCPGPVPDASSLLPSRNYSAFDKSASIPASWTSSFQRKKVPNSPPLTKCLTSASTPAVASSSFPASSPHCNYSPRIWRAKAIDSATSTEDEKPSGASRPV